MRVGLGVDGLGNGLMGTEHWAFWHGVESKLLVGRSSVGTEEFITITYFSRSKRLHIFFLKFRQYISSAPSRGWRLFRGNCKALLILVTLDL